ncbi:MAG: ribosomal L7Ae/L30e/S12e/Gadd45 family protein [Clostridiales bacterium]|nr:ribosomal L7Ae/L30e/S12e/Gadd45 family protein [Clostridiales bacterium]
MDNKKLMQFLGLCQRAGKLASGETGAANAVKNGEAELVIVAENASDNTKKKFNDSAAYYNKKIIVFGDKYELGRAIGKDERASVKFL